VFKRNLIAAAVALALPVQRAGAVRNSEKYA
jgi:hypothetical protein